MVEPLIVSVPRKLSMPPPASAEFPLMVEPLTVSVPWLAMPPPEPPAEFPLMVEPLIVRETSSVLRMPPAALAFFPLEIVIPEMETSMGTEPQLPEPQVKGAQRVKML